MLTRFLIIGLFVVSTSIFAAHPPLEDLDTVKLQLRWKHQFQFSGYYMAKEKGFYQEQGLNVEINELISGAKHTELLFQGLADYIVSGTDVLNERTSGKSVVVLAAIAQTSPLALLVKESSGIKKAEDLRGKKIMIDPANQFLVVEMLKRVDLSKQDYTIVPVSFDINDLINDKVDAVVAYTTNEAHWLEEKNIEYRHIMPSDYGIDIYDDILATSQNEVDQHPIRVFNFRQASIKGWKYALSHIDETIDIILKKYNTQGKTRRHLEFEAQALKKLINPQEIEVGSMRYEHWRKMANQYIEWGIIGKNIDLDRFIYKPSSNVISRIAITSAEEKWLESHPIIAYAQRNGITLNIGMVLFIMFAIFWIYIVRRLNKKITKKHEKSLDVLITQSRHVVMGEMIAMLAHQWKQPLTALMLKTGTVKDKLKMMDVPKADQEFLENHLNGIENILNDQNHLIQDFRDFFHPNKDSITFNLAQAIKSSIEVLDGLFVKGDIKLDINIDEKIEITGFERDLRHVIINILKNSIDQIVHKETQNSLIKIMASVNNHIVNITIEDNAGGIDEDIIKTIFEPYVSTKQLNGTGLGLYISKRIVQESFKGDISVENTKNGAKFHMSLLGSGG